MSRRKEIREVFESIIKRMGLQEYKVQTRRRDPEMLKARISIAKELNKYGYGTPTIGWILNRDHSTILGYLKKRKN